MAGTSPAMTIASPARQRAHGRVALSCERMGPASSIRRLAESGSARVRLPTTRDGVPEAVLINTAGGIAGGDVVETEIALAEGARLVATTAAAEKVYRSDGEVSRILTRAALGASARLDWLPQETILYDRARLRRALDVSLVGSATALLFEAVVFGRAAHEEVVREGSYEERWRVARDGRLVYADTFRIDGRIAETLARPAVTSGRRALASLLYVAPDAEARIEEARAHLDGAASECGASAWNGLLLVRWLAHDIATLRGDVARFMNPFRGRPLPRVWHL